MDEFTATLFGTNKNCPEFKTCIIRNENILENFSNEYFYLACIAFVKKVKMGVFAEHSPMLDDISGGPNWNKLTSGLLKIYKAEFLEKVPIMQHFLFGSIIKLYIRCCFSCIALIWFSLCI